jgi:hypothetical protein
MLEEALPRTTPSEPMRVIELQEPAVRFFGDKDGEVTITPALVAAFETDVDGNPTSNRKPGDIHLGQIIHHLYAKIEGKSAEKPVGDALTSMNIKMSIGVAFEYLLERVLSLVYPSTKLVKLESICEDGIWMTPDRYDVEEELVEEWKATWFSSKKAATTKELVDHFWYWQIQIRAYCRAMKVKKAKLRVWFINGNYAPPRPIPPRTFYFEFTDQDLDENWEMVLRTAKEIGLFKCSRKNNSTKSTKAVKKSSRH